MKKFMGILAVAFLIPCMLLIAACSGKNVDDLLDNNSCECVHEAIKYGDVNFDGIVDYNDVLVLMKYLDGTIKLSPAALERADVNGDGKITYADAALIKYYVDGDLDILTPEGSKQILWGDANGDGVVDENDLERMTSYVWEVDTTSYINILNSTLVLSHDGTLDLLSVTALTRFLDYTQFPNLIQEIPVFIANDEFGDITLDGTIDADDVAMLTAYHAGTQKLSLQQIKNAGYSIKGEWKIVTVAQLELYIDSLI